jgi:hypothetical protein
MTARFVRGSRVAAATLSALALGCTQDRPTEPAPFRAVAATSASVTTAPAAPACVAGTCLLTNTILPLQSGVYEPDSADLVVPLGEVLVEPQAGDSVTLAVTVSPDLAASFPPGEQILAVVSVDTVRLPLRRDSTETTIYRAPATDSVRIRISLTRRLTAAPRSGTFTVSLHFGSAPLLWARTPWMAAAAPGAAASSRLAASATTCTASAPGPSSCPSISVSIVPYAPGDHFGADFQSSPGSGGNAPITVTFSNPVSSVTITIEDPGPPGNAMTAYRADGSIAGRVSFTGCGCSGTNIPDTRSITAAGIVRLLLTPAPLDYVAYEGLSFVPEPLCNFFLSPPADAVLVNNAVQVRLNALWTASNPADNFSNPQTKERGGLFFARKDGSIGFYEFHYRAGSGPCEIDWTPSVDVQKVLRDSGEVVGQVHTHPIPPGDYPNPGTCGADWQRDQHKYPTITVLPGPSPRDKARYDSGDAPFPSYIVDRDSVYTIRPNGTVSHPSYVIEHLPRNPINTCPPTAP